MVNQVKLVSKEQDPVYQPTTPNIDSSSVKALGISSEVKKANEGIATLSKNARKKHNKKAREAENKKTEQAMSQVISSMRCVPLSSKKDESGDCEWLTIDESKKDVPNLLDKEPLDFVLKFSEDCQLIGQFCLSKLFMWKICTGLSKLEIFDSKRFEGYKSSIAQDFLTLYEMETDDSKKSIALSDSLSNLQGLLTSFYQELSQVTKQGKTSLLRKRAENHLEELNKLIELITQFVSILKDKYFYNNLQAILGFPCKNPNQLKSIEQFYSFIEFELYIFKIVRWKIPELRDLEIVKEKVQDILKEKNKDLFKDKIKKLEIFFSSIYKKHGEYLDNFIKSEKTTQPYNRFYVATICSDWVYAFIDIVKKSFPRFFMVWDFISVMHSNLVKFIYEDLKGTLTADPLPKLPFQDDAGLFSKFLEKVDGDNRSLLERAASGFPVDAIKGKLVELQPVFKLVSTKFIFLKPLLDLFDKQTKEIPQICAEIEKMRLDHIKEAQELVKTLKIDDPEIKEKFFDILQERCEKASGPLCRYLTVLKIASFSHLEELTAQQYEGRLSCFPKEVFRYVTLEGFYSTLFPEEKPLVEDYVDPSSEDDEIELSNPVVQEDDEKKQTKQPSSSHPRKEKPINISYPAFLGKKSGVQEPFVLRRWDNKRRKIIRKLLDCNIRPVSGRGKGSHQVFENPEHPEDLIVISKPKGKKGFKSGTLHGISDSVK